MNGTLRVEVTDGKADRNVKLIIQATVEGVDREVTVDVDGREFSKALALPGKFFAMAKVQVLYVGPKRRGA